jgi:hypothetical protein
LQDAHETYLICQAVPQYQPTPDELSDYNLRVMAQLHDLHRRIDREQQAKMMGATDG